MPVPALSVIIAGLGLLWLMAKFSDVQVIEQLSFVALLITTAVALLGFSISRQIMFPLGFLFFAVPMGEGLIPPMMDFTAVFTVKMLQLTGIRYSKKELFLRFRVADGLLWRVVAVCAT